MTRNRIVALVFAVLAAIGLAACTTSSDSTKNDAKQTNNQLKRYQANQPIPLNDWSQFRQTVIDVEQAQIHGVATTTFFFNQGVSDPIDVCPSIGFAVPSTAQLTNPTQLVGGDSRNGVIGQAEPNGVYTGDSTGTYVVCVAKSGLRYPNYWEGFVKTIGGPAHWDTETHSIVLDGAPTVVLKTKK